MTDSDRNHPLPPPVDMSGRLRRMLDPRATYNETEAKASRAWWILYFVGWLSSGLLSLIAIAFVWHDKKFLKQMALASMYSGIPGSLLFAVSGVGNIIGSANAFPNQDSLFVLLFMVLMFGGGSVIFGFVVAWYAQGKIDRAQQNTKSERDGTNIEET